MTAACWPENQVILGLCWDMWDTFWEHILRRRVHHFHSTLRFACRKGQFIKRETQFSAMFYMMFGRTLARALNSYEISPQPYRSCSQWKAATDLQLQKDCFSDQAGPSQPVALTGTRSLLLLHLAGWASYSWVILLVLSVSVKYIEHLPELPLTSFGLWAK